ncbi:conserved hypothetical protein [Neospora caninum Liverpool]|uniref:Uncharacterized protein n=1 Tax=Neospora caninum (strain Liverpool) TaxID=572307 RepID=F0VB37_NEOCL|nr:conserved hypothetical protein [Neospora caninum Liverpool]CBZ50859.1 conserved hypothetical protein [Neospora caninum Liverpool]CEL68161.1 TPA: hypothetical protein BN1204_039340 [Neospora caninum Liverpool]|eukprot:XP_003880892.1 conserved hypothetical protein [Neospora caninum Liverpool]
MVGRHIRRAVYVACVASVAATSADAAFQGTTTSSNIFGTPFPDPLQFFVRANPFLSPTSIADSFGFLSRASPSDMFRALTENYRIAAAMPEQFVRAAADAATLLTMQQQDQVQGREQSAGTPENPSFAATPSRGFFIPGMPFYPANWMPAKSMFPLAENPNDWFNNFLFVLWAANHPAETAHYLKLAKMSKYQGWDHAHDESFSHSGSSESASYEGQYTRHQKTPQPATH